MEFQKYICDDNFIMECSVSGNDLDIKDELTKIKHKLLDEMKKMETKFKNIKCVIKNDYDITNDTNTVDTLRGANFRFIDEKDILKAFEKAYNKRLDELLEWNKSDIEEFKGEHKDTRLKKMSYSNVINRGFKVIIAMNNKRNNWFLNLFRDIF